MSTKSMSKWKKITAASLGSLLLASTTACGGSEAASSDEASGAKGSFDEVAAAVKTDTAAADLLPADIKEAGMITMAADLHYPPTSFLAEDNKTPIGYNVDIATLLGKTLGLEVEVKNVTWDNVIPGIAVRPLRLHRHQHDSDAGAARGPGHGHLLGGRVVPDRADGQPAGPEPGRRVHLRARRSP